MGSDLTEVVENDVWYGDTCRARGVEWPIVGLYQQVLLGAVGGGGGGVRKEGCCSPEVKEPFILPGSVLTLQEL